jgi:RHS repeat-associated protein
MYGRGVDEVYSEDDGETEWYLKDQIGSVRTVVDGAGVRLRSYRYDSFGGVPENAPRGLGEILFAGREFDTESGIGFFRNRSYSPCIGRFLQVDPELPLGYAYARNNPQLFVDPFGTTEIIEFNVILSAELVNSRYIVIIGRVGQTYIKWVFDLVLNDVILISSLL